MAYEIPVLSISLTAAADFSSSQYRFVYVDSNGEAALVANTATHPVGVVQNDPEADQEAAVMVYGVSKVVAGGTITAGATVRSDTSGRAVAASAGEVAAGVALQSASSSEIIAVLLTPNGLVS